MLIHYKIDFWDELDNKNNHDEGFTSGTTLGEGVNRICKFYGNDNVIEITVYATGDVLTKDEVYDEFKVT